MKIDLKYSVYVMGGSELIYKHQPCQNIGSNIRLVGKYQR